MATKNKDKIISILGENYTLGFSTEKDDPELKGLSGYCMPSEKKIVIDKDMKNPNATKKWVMRHEIIHAFLYESGLDKEAPWADSEEQLVDWIALQFPKMLKTMQDADAI
jgi:Zn-dependent peptidase ImmA (M78 family)